MVIGTFSSCDDEVDKVIYDGEISSNRTFLSFEKTVYLLPVNVDSEGTVDIILNSSTRSGSDRTFNIMLNVDDSNANEDIYTLPTTVTIPANSYQGTITVLGIDNDDLDGNQQTIKFSLSDLSDLSNIDMDTNEVTVNIFEVCPVPDTFFTGMYLIEQVSAEIDGPTLSTGEIVDVYVDEELDPSGLTRSFLTLNFPNYDPCGGYVPFSVSLICNELIVPAQDNACVCVDGTNWFGPASTNDTYNLTDGDTELFVSFTDDANMDCGPTAVTRYKFTKQ